jgi:flagellar assembly protein FliH
MSEKFAFDTEFDAVGGIARQARRERIMIPSEEVEAIRRQAFAEGERAAQASIENQQAQQIAHIANACNQALPRLAEVAHEHRVASAELAMACAKAIAGAALHNFPQEPLNAALDALAREIEAQPKLIITTSPHLAEGIQWALEDMAQRIGFQGAIQVKGDAAFGPCAFTLDFGDGAASYDPIAAMERVNETLMSALAAEGLHAEPLIPSEG